MTTAQRVRRAGVATAAALVIGGGGVAIGAAAADSSTPGTTAAAAATATPGPATSPAAPPAAPSATGRPSWAETARRALSRMMGREPDGQLARSVPPAADNGSRPARSE